MAPVLFSSQLRFAKMSLKQNGGFLSSCTSLYRTCHKYKSKPVYPSEHVSKDVMKYETLLLKNCTNSEAHIQSWNDKVICFFRSNLKSFGLEIMLVRRNCFRFETEEKLKTVFISRNYIVTLMNATHISLDNDDIVRVQSPIHWAIVLLRPKIWNIYFALWKIDPKIIGHHMRSSRKWWKWTHVHNEMNKTSVCRARVIARLLMRKDFLRFHQINSFPQERFCHKNHLERKGS